VDEAAWGALTLSLTVLGGLYTWFAFRSRGFVAGLRGIGFTLIPVALLLTDTLQMVSRIGDAVSHWALNLAFNPFTWLGIVLAVLSVVCFVVAGFLANRGAGQQPRKDRKTSGKNTGKDTPKDTGRQLAKGRGTRSQPVLPDIDPELAEIEAMLRERGIS
jgi:heme exporter protein D